MYISKQAQEKRVYDPNKSSVMQSFMTPTPGGAGVPLNSISDEGDLGAGIPSTPQNTVQSLQQAANILQQLYFDVSNVSSGLTAPSSVLIDELAKAIQTIGNQPLQDRIQNLKGLYESNPHDARNKINNLVVAVMRDVDSLLQIHLQDAYQKPQMNGQQQFFSTRNGSMKKTANLKEEIRQHFNNFAVSDIQIINKLQFLYSMIDTDASPIEEPKEYTRPKLGKNYQPSELHGTGGIGKTCTEADVKREIKDLEEVLKGRGYTDETIQECVAIINTNQRSQLDIGDKGDIESREGKGFSDKEEEMFKGIVHGDEQVIEAKSNKKILFSKIAQELFVGDYDIKEIGEYTYKVKRIDNQQLNNDDEKRIEGILMGRGYSNVFVELTQRDEDGYYPAYVGYPQKQEDLPKEEFGKRENKIQKLAALPGMTVGPTTLGTVWCPKTKEPIEAYLCWNVCIDGIKTGEKVVCGKRIFDAMVSDNNEHALRRTTVFQHNNEDAVIAGPNLRLPDDVRRSTLSDEEIPTERRLEELQKQYPVPHNTDSWTNSPTLSDDKKHDWSQKVKIASKALQNKFALDEEVFKKYIGSLDTTSDYRDYIISVVAAIPVDIQQGKVDANEVLSAIDSAVEIIRQNFDDNPDAYELLLQTLGGVVFKFIDEDLGRQILYVAYSEHPQLMQAGRNIGRQAYLNYKMVKQAQLGGANRYEFPKDHSKFYDEVTKPRMQEMRKKTDESYLEYAQRIIGIIKQEGFFGDNLGWTVGEAASALAAAIPYPTKGQFILVMNLIRDFMTQNFGEDAMFYVAAQWVGDYWDTSKIETNFSARRHIKNHFPEIIRLYSEFHPDFPNSIETEEDERILAGIYKDFPSVPNASQYLVI